MRRKWTIKLTAPILALGLVSACNTANDNNDNTPQDTDNTPQNTNYQQNQAPDNENDQDMRHNNNMNVPDNDLNHNRSREPNMHKNDKGNGPEHGTESTKNLGK